MNENLTIAIVSTSGAVIVAVASLVTNTVWMGKTFKQLDKRMGEMGARLSVIETDLKAFYKEQSGHASDSHSVWHRTADRAVSADAEHPL